MKFGAREICDVVLKAKEKQKIGEMIFEKGQPVMYFDSLKTSSMEQASTTVYAQGGRGNSRLVAWDGDKTITFTMEDALLSPMSFAILTKAKILDVSTTDSRTMTVHITEKINASDVTGTTVELKNTISTTVKTVYYCWLMTEEQDDFKQMEKIAEGTGDEIIVSEKPSGAKSLFVDYYTDKTATNAGDYTTMTIEPESFESNFYLEASTLFRNKSGVDLPAEFIIPNCKPQSAMTFSMSGTGDPSTFTFTMDAFPGYTQYDGSKKVLAAIQIMPAVDSADLGTADGLTQF